MATQENTSNGKTASKPTHTLRKKLGYGKRVEFETVGVAWTREDGGMYIKLHGTQIIDSGFYAFPVREQTSNESGQ